jgi:hypothetical protein
MAIAIRRLLLPLLALLIGALALGYSAVFYQQSRDVEQHGIEAPVRAIDNAKKIKRSGNRITFRAAITYTHRDGTAFTAHGAISDQSIDAFRGGQPMRVRYLPDHPEVIRVVGDEDEGSSWLLVIIGGTALVYGIVALVLPARRGTGKRRRNG